MSSDKEYGMKKKMAVLLVTLLALVMVLGSCGKPEVQADDRITRMENLPGPIDDVIFIQTGETTYQITITLDNGYDYFTFDLNVNEGQPFLPSGDAMST